MRRRGEVVEVRLGRVGEGIAGLDEQALPGLVEGPSQFLWRNRLWRVLQVQARWVESGAWWEQPGVRAARGDWTDPAWAGVDGDEMGGVGPDGGAPDGTDVHDLLCEQEVWRVEAAAGQRFSRGIYELAHSTGDGRWVLRGVVD